MRAIAKIACVTVAGLFFATGIHAQKAVSVDWYGFVAAQSHINTRESATAAGGFLYLYPLDQKITEFGEDANQHTQYSWFGTMARVGMKLSGPEILGASSCGQVEIEFSGFNGSAAVANPVLYRHAYMALDWDNSSLILGQTWHPMNELFPSVQSIAIGAPFNALNRSPQLRYNYFLGDNRQFRLSAAALFQYMNASIGPDGRSSVYQKNCGIPELYAGADMIIGDFTLGIGGEWMRIAPRIATSAGRKTTENIDAFSGMVQAKYDKGAFSWKAKALAGQNMSHLGICTGFGEARVGDHYEWQNLKALSTWTNFSYGKTVKAGLLGGYMKNLGGKEGCQFDAGKIYAIGGGNLDAMYRVAPSITWLVGNMNIGCEYELTSVAYGDVQSRGNVANSHWITNHHLILSVLYSF